MPLEDLRREIAFGLENLSKLYHSVVSFSSYSTEDRSLVTSALAYECLGYYNAAEHLMVRVLKHLNRETSSGAFSHRDTLRSFGEVVSARLPVDDDTIVVLEELMAFRHVATKIYGFLIDREKLDVIVADILRCHSRIVKLFEDLIVVIEESGAGP